MTPRPSTEKTRRIQLRKEPPAGATELVDVDFISLITLTDGTLLSNNGRTSQDGGQTWSDPRAFECSLKVDGLLRLRSGGIAATGERDDGTCVAVSRDEGQTWCDPVVVFPRLVAADGTVLFRGTRLPDAMVQLSDGRLLFTADWSGAGNHPEHSYHDASAYGQWRGHRYQIEGHGHYPETGGTFVAYSDDEGQTWLFAQGTASRDSLPSLLMGWFDHLGNPGPDARAACIGECTLAETADTRVLLLAYPYASRVLHSYSSDRGESWSLVRPTALAGSVSPARLRRIPGTDDLICVWNHVSREEIRRGFRRGRLTAAISQDNGNTWGSFKTLELSHGMDDVASVPSEYPVDLCLADSWIGEMPDEWAVFSYPNICFGGDNVFIIYHRGWLDEKPSPRPSRQTNAEFISAGAAAMTKIAFQTETVLRIYPRAWFYRA